MPRIVVSQYSEVMEELTRALRAAGITDAAMTLIGAVDSAVISTMAHGDARLDQMTSYAEPLELTGTGEVVNGEPHVHVVLCREGDQTVGGHLHAARVRHHFVHVYVMPI